MLRFLTLEELRNLDSGRVATAFEQAMKRIVADCEDRPGEERPRKLELSAEITPVCGEDGKCEGVRGKFQIRDKIPTRRSKVYSFGVKSGGRLYFSDEDPSNVEQLTFGDVEEDGRARQKFAGEN
ncbi:MAG: hypothetical protein PHU85_00075 [Phycisphaerae bacterium]|nr:hypothetical protein [Phycisphaerae bacterium]